MDPEMPQGADEARSVVSISRPLSPLRRLAVAAVITITCLVLNSCGGGGGSGGTSGSGGSTSGQGLVWDSGQWDNSNWQ
jgi:hypothetical protein